jgi:hypothetical protein
MAFFFIGLASFSVTMSVTTTFAFYTAVTFFMVATTFAFYTAVTFFIVATTYTFFFIAGFKSFCLTTFRPMMFIGFTHII